MTVFPLGRRILDPLLCASPESCGCPLGFRPTLRRTLSKAVARLTTCLQWQQLYSMAFGEACLCALVVVQCTTVPHFQHQTVRSEVGLSVYGVDDPVFSTCDPRCLLKFGRKTSFLLDCVSNTCTSRWLAKNTSTSARTSHCSSTSCTTHCLRMARTPYNTSVLAQDGYC